jgi:hypothetical protein
LIQSAQRIERLSLLLAVLAAGASLLCKSWSVTLSVALGGVLATLNFFALRRILQGIFTGKSPRKQVLLGVLLTLKFSVIAAGIYLIMKWLPVNAIALIAGLSVVVLSIFVEGFRTVLRGASPAAPVE